MEEEIKTILNSFGWSQGFHIPVTNEKNKTLEFKVESTLKKRTDAILLLEDLTSSVNAIRCYSNKIGEQRSQNERILIDFRKHLDIEGRLFNDVHHQKQKIIRDTKNVLDKKRNLLGENEVLQMQLNDLNRKCEDVKKNINWSREIELTWIEYTNKGNEDISLFKKCDAADNVKFKEMELKRLKLVNELNEYKNLFNEKTNDLIAAQCNLTKSCCLFENLRGQRKWLVEQWRNTTRILKTRHDQINDIMREINILTQVSRSVETATLQQKSFYEEQVNHNSQLETQIQDIITVTYKQQMANDKLMQEWQTTINQVANKRLELGWLAIRIRENRTTNTIIKREINRIKAAFGKLSRHYEKLKIKALNMKTRGTSLVERINQLEFILRAEQKAFNSSAREHKKMRTLSQKIESKITYINEQSTSIMLQVKQLIVLRSKLAKTAEERRLENEKQQKIVDSIEEKLEEIIVRLRSLKNSEKSFESKMRRENELLQLTGDFTYKKNIMDTIREEVRVCKTDLKKLNEDVNFYTNRIKEMKCEKQNLIISLEGGEKLLSKTVDGNQEKEVTENLLRLRMNQLENILCRNNDKVLSMEKQRIDLQMALQERLTEIQSSSNVLKIRKKTLQEEISTLKRSVDDVNLRLTRLFKKYEIIVTSVGKESEDDQQPTVTNYKIKLVKERYLLLEKGDQLDEQIRKTEKEIQATENTLMLMNVTNNTFKKNIMSIDEQSDEYQEKMKLLKEREKLGHLIRDKKHSILAVSEKIKMLKVVLLEQENNARQLNSTKKVKNHNLTLLEKDVNEQRVKLQRVKSRLLNLKSSLKSIKNVDLLAREFTTIELQRANKEVLEHLSKLVLSRVELKSPLTEYLTNKNISLPLNEISCSKKCLTTNISGEMLVTRPAVDYHNISYH